MTDPIGVTEQGEAPGCVEAAQAGAPAACVAASALVKCSTSEVCISDDATHCGAVGGCFDECAATGEYALACNQQALGGRLPPVGCVAKEVAADGTLYACCPCTP